MDLITTFTNILALTVKDIFPVVALLLFFQFVILRRPLPDWKRVTLGFLFVLIGLTLFLDGLETALFPIGKIMAKTLVDKESGEILADANAEITEELLLQYPGQGDLMIVLERSLFNAALAEARAYNLTGAENHLMRLLELKPESKEATEVQQLARDRIRRISSPVFVAPAGIGPSLLGGGSTIRQR